MTATDLTLILVFLPLGAIVGLLLIRWFSLRERAKFNAMCQEKYREADERRAKRYATEPEARAE